MIENEVDCQVGETACDHCGTKFKAKRPWQRFCSSTCRFAEWDGQHPRQKANTATLET
jgi:hypothetical protein